MQEAAERSGDWLVCRPGCTQCCLGPFEITALDAMRLRRGLNALQATDPDKAARVQARVARYPSEELDDVPCPALDTETGYCDLYEWRPVTCRLFGPVTHVDDGLAACELCYQGATEEEMAACAVQVDAEGLEGEILALCEDAGSTSVAAALR